MSVKYFQEYLKLIVEFSVSRYDDGVGGGWWSRGWWWRRWRGATHFVIHNKSRAQPDLPQPVPKILMTLSGDDCLG